METYEHSFLQHPIIERNTEMLDQYAKMDGTVTRMDEQYSAIDENYKNVVDPNLYTALGQLAGSVGGSLITAGTNKSIAQLQADIAAKRDALNALIAQQQLAVNAQLQGTSQAEKLKQRKTIIILAGVGVILLGGLGLFIYMKKRG